MRNYIQTIIAVLAMALISHKGHAQTVNADSINKKMMAPEEVFGKQVFNAFKTNNEALYAALQPTNEEYKALLQSWLVAKVKGLTDAKIDELIDRRKREADARMKQDFADYRKQSIDAGVVWAKAVYQSYDNQPVYPEEVHQKYIFGTIWFRVNGVRYLIEEVQAVEIPEGYRLQKILRIRKAEDIN